MSGALYAGQVQFVVPTNFNVVNSVLFLCAVVLGGQGNKLGVILGASSSCTCRTSSSAGPRSSASRSTATKSPQYKYLFFGLALMVLMIFRPQGLIPVRQKLLTYGRELFVAARRRSKEARTTEPEVAK